MSMSMSSSSSELDTPEETNEQKLRRIMEMPDVPMGQLPPHLQRQRTRVLCASDAPIHTESIQYSGAYASMGVDNSLRMDHFFKNFRIEVIGINRDPILPTKKGREKMEKAAENNNNQGDDTEKEEVLEFDMIGIDASIANAFRRILISEIPTMAIEKVLIANNTSVVQDEVLAHRLGLIPIQVDPRLFEYMSENDTPNEKNTIVFKLHVRCTRGSPRITVKSDELQWLPDGSGFEVETENPSSNQKTRSKTYTSFSCSQASLPEFANSPIGPKHKNITIARLGPGQEIELEAHAVKGIGKTHAKWSPVATAWYRMLPEVELLQEFKGDEADKLVEKCPAGVFDIEDIRGIKRATVARPRDCTLCRECIRGDSEERVALRRVRDHFIFVIESTGALPPDVLFTEAVKILEDKCERVISELS